LFVWPAINEAYGMAILEAQAGGFQLSPEIPGAFGKFFATEKLVF